MAFRSAFVTCLTALLFGGCVGSPPGAVPYSHLTYERTYDLVTGVLTDQKLTLTRQDRRGGVVAGSERGVTITATLTPQVDGTTRVLFTEAPEGADPVLLKRVVDGYNERMGKLTSLTFGAPCPEGRSVCP